MTYTLAGWLLEQIAEDERAAALWRREGAVIAMRADLDPDIYVREPWVRVLAECAAKRAIVVNAGRRSARTPAPTPWDDILRALATVYADRPGWREEWRA